MDLNRPEHPNVRVEFLSKTQNEMKIVIKYVLHRIVTSRVDCFIQGVTIFQ